MTLGGMCKVNETEPVCYVSYFEADAHARWAGARLPTEAEWEIAGKGVPVEGNFVEDGLFHPAAAPGTYNPDEFSVADAAVDRAIKVRVEGVAPELEQLYGDVWEWTNSAYLAYPGYQPVEGALGEYNGKFMNNQFVLRGGSCATSLSHIRLTYRNFFPPSA